MGVDGRPRSEAAAVIGDIDKQRAIIIDDEIDTGTTIFNTIRATSLPF